MKTQKKKAPKKVPHPYQVSALDALRAHVEAGNKRALLVMATGLGKTFVSALLVKWYLETYGGNVLFLIDQAEPIERARDEYAEAMHGMGIRTALWNANVKEGIGSAHIVFTTFQSMAAGLREQLRRDHFTLVIVDEAHHGQAVTYKETIQYFTPNFLLGMTATPDRMDGLDIREIFGEEVFNLPLAEALRKRLLAKVVYNVVSDNINIRELRKLIKRVRGGDRRVSRRQINDTIFLPELDAKIVERVRTEHPGRKTIYFCNGIEHVERMREHAPGAAPYHYRRSPNDLKRWFNEFRDGSLLEILVVDKFNESVDVPAAEVLVFVRATDSMTVWLQQLGRGLRDPNKTVYIYDFVANCDRVLWVAELGRQVGVGQGVDKDPLQVTGITIAFSEETRDLLDMLQGLEGDPWEYRYRQLAEYRDKYGDSNVPKKWRENRVLAAWVSTQRYLKKKNCLSPECIAKLEAIGFEWVPFETAWQKRYQQLKAYKAEHGDCCPEWVAGEEEKTLAIWCARQRAKKATSQLSELQVALLDALGFEWVPFETAWQKRYQQLKAYKAEHGDCNVPWKCEKDPGLSEWMVHQREIRKKGRLSERCIALLDGLGFSWDALEVAWQEAFSKLESFKEKHGHCRVTFRSKDDRVLAQWVSTQRMAKKENKLSVERIALLDALGFQWFPFEVAWERRYGQLKAYKAEHGDCSVPFRKTRDRGLFNWLSRQRKAKKENKLSVERIALLDALSLDWNPKPRPK